jgi:hypothetical protein
MVALSEPGFCIGAGAVHEAKPRDSANARTHFNQSMLGMMLS